MQFDDDRLDQRGDGDRFLNSRGNVTDAELQGSEGGVRTNIPPDFLSVVDAMEIHEQLHVVVVLAPGTEVVGYTGAGKPPKDRCAVGLQAGVATHPEGRTGGERQQVREEITHGIHQVDHRVAVRHGDVHVHAKDQQGTRELLQFLHDVLVALAWRNHLLNPIGKGVRAGRGHLQSHPLCRCHQRAAGAVQLLAQLRNVSADPRAHLDDRLVKLWLDLFAHVRRGGGNQFADVRTKLQSGGINNLKLFFNADGEAVTHSGARPWGTRVEEAGPALSYSDRGRNTSEEVLGAWAPRDLRNAGTPSESESGIPSPSEGTAVDLTGIRGRFDQGRPFSLSRAACTGGAQYVCGRANHRALASTNPSVGSRVRPTLGNPKSAAAGSIRGSTPDGPAWA